VLLVYGCGIELFQLFIPNHVECMLDILADLFGIVSGLGVIFLLERILDDRQDEADRLSV
jgi:VanZ family protein